MNFFLSYFRDISAINNLYDTRSKTNQNLSLPRVNLNYLNYGQFGVKYAAVKTGNETPNKIKASSLLKRLGKK